jgi:hypothetical protein
VDVPYLAPVMSAALFQSMMTRATRHQLQQRPDLVVEELDVAEGAAGHVHHVAARQQKILRTVTLFDQQARSAVKFPAG